METGGTPPRLGDMPTLLLDRASKTGRRPTPESDRHAGGSAYLTDGMRLFRTLPPEAPGTVLLEDCFTLDCVELQFDEVAAGMRLVRATSA